MKFSETYAMLDTSGEITDYLFLDPSATTHWTKPDRRAFNLAISFSVSSKITYNYPVVFDDRTMADGTTIRPIEFKDVPSAIKRKLTAWLKLQPKTQAAK